MLLVEDGRIALDDPIGRWLPELASPRVVRTPASPVDDVVPADRPITVLDLLTARAGYGFGSDFSLPAVELLFTVQTDGREVQLRPHPDGWVANLARIPLLSQPGQAWLYDTCSDLQGVLIARVTGQPLPEFLAERLFERLGMSDTGFIVPAAKRDRFTSFYRPDPAGGLQLADAPDGQWSHLPAFPAGSGGLVGTIDDWHRFARVILDQGAVDDRRILSPESVRQMTTNHLTRSPARRRRAVSGRPGLGLRRLGGHRGHTSVERAGTVRLGRGYRNHGVHRRPPARSPSCSPRWARPTPSRPR